MRQWLRRNALMAVTALAVMATLLGSGKLILSVAEREDAAREAQVKVAQIEPLALGLTALPAGPLGGASVDPALAVTIEQARTALQTQSAQLASDWPSPAAESTRLAAQRLSDASERLMDLLATGELPAARRLEASAAQPAAAALDRALRAEQRLLEDQARGARRRAQLGTIAITAIVGLLLVVGVFALVATRRRRERADTEQRVTHDSEQRLRALVEHGSDMITVIAPDGTVLYQAGAIIEMLGHQPEALEGTKLSDWVHPDDVFALTALSASGGGSARELRLRSSDRRFVTCEARASSLLEDAHWRGIVLNIRDVSDRKALEERLRYQAFHDNLTGLANGGVFRDRLENALGRADRRDEPVTVFLIDVDDFKSVNDSFGHAAGDELLETIAERLRSSVREADTIARLGGDEFGVILEGGRASPHPEEVAERLVAAVAEPVEVDGGRLTATVSVGIARSVRGDRDADSAILHADIAMYSAKAQGKGGWAVYGSHMHKDLQRRLELKADLLRAVVDADQFELYYQPIVTIDDGLMVGLEALLRWNHPTYGQIAPGEFIPLAEESVAIVQIGRWVLEEACREGKRWVDMSGDLTIAVNVSVRQLESTRLVDDVRRALEQTSFPADRLVLEVTESAVVTDIEGSVSVLRELKELGIQIAIDDFGTGYSSLSQLDYLPVDIIKVDRSFVLHSHDREEQTALFRAIRDIGESLHLKTIAEGIESPEQLHELQSLHWSLGQGFLFSRPKPAAEIDRLVREREVAAT